MAMDRDAVKKFCSILGAHFACAPFSILWFYGNLSAYMESYFLFSCKTNCRDADSQWILALYGVGQVPGLLFIKPILNKLGLKWSGVVMMVICGLGLLSSAWSLQYSVAATIAIYGILLGPSTGATFLVSVQLVSGWAPERTALFMATVTSYPTILSVVLNQVITVYVNPDNLKADAVVGPRTYFSQQEILSRVPGAVIILAAMTLGQQIIGYILISNPPTKRKDTQIEKDFSDNVSVKDIISSNGKAEPFVSPDLKLSTSDSTICGSKIGDEHLSSKICGAESNVSCIGVLGQRDFKLQKQTRDNSPTKDAKTMGIPQRTHQGNTNNSVVLNENTPIVQDQNRDTPIANRNDTIKTKNEGKDLPISYTPCEAMRTSAFYSLFFLGLSMEYALLLKANFYKQFGQVYIKNDQYLTLVGTLLPIASVCSRLVFGQLMDKKLLNIKETITISLSFNTLLCSMWYLTARTNAILYLFLVMGLAVAQGVYYLIGPCAALVLFGPDHLTVNWALSFSSVSIAGFLTPIVVSPLLHTLGWFWLFTSCGLVSLFTLCLVVASNFDTQSRGRKEPKKG